MEHFIELGTHAKGTDTRKKQKKLYKRKANTIIARLLRDRPERALAFRRIPPNSLQLGLRSDLSSGSGPVRGAWKLSQHGQVSEEGVKGAFLAGLCAHVASVSLRAAVREVRTADPRSEGAAVVLAAGRLAARGLPIADVAVFARVVQKSNFHRAGG